MRKKLLSKTYLRDVKEDILALDFTKKDYYLAKKKIIKTINTKYLHYNKLNNRNMYFNRKISLQQPL